MCQPKPFCFNPKNIKAFVLGCDPTNFSDNGKLKLLNTVFGIGEDHRYFKDILENLKLIGLHLEDIYVQNLITDYPKEETGKNKDWEKIAEEYLPHRIKEFDNIDQRRNIPILLTAERLYKFLLNKGEKPAKAEDLYKLNSPIPVPPELNKLKRPLIPLYRHFNYSLKKYPVYQQTLTEIMV